MPRQVSYKKIFLLVVLVGITLLIMKYTTFGRVTISPFEAVLRDVFSPVQGLATQVGHRLRGLVSFPFDVVGMTGRNRQLEDRVATLEGRLKQMEEYRQENERLKELLDFRSNIGEAMGFELTGAAVIGRDPGNWFGFLSINKGSEDGIRGDMTVITPEGLVGRITSVSRNTAQVLLISDPRSGVGTLIQETRAPGMVNGVASAPGEVQMVHIPIGSVAKEGHIVITSGLGSLYPKGIPVGTITSVGREPSGLFNSAMIDPFVDFDRLEEVLVITRVRSPRTTVSLADIPSPWGYRKHYGGSPGTIRAGEVPGSNNLSNNNNQTLPEDNRPGTGTSGTGTANVPPVQREQPGVRNNAPNRSVPENQQQHSPGNDGASPGAREQLPGSPQNVPGGPPGGANTTAGT